MDSRDLTRLRDNIISKKALAEETEKKKNEAINKYMEVLKSIDSDTVTSLLDKGIDVSSILNVDENRLRTDSDYLETYKSNIDFVLNSIKSKLEGLLL